MTIVTLEDETTYIIDTNERWKAESAVEHKLRDRMDCRKIKDVSVFEGCAIDRNSKYYNSGQYYDGVPLKCKTGWSYKWSDGRCREFR